MNEELKLEPIEFFYSQHKWFKSTFLPYILVMVFLVDILLPLLAFFIIPIQTRNTIPTGNMFNLVFGFAVILPNLLIWPVLFLAYLRLTLNF